MRTKLFLESTQNQRCFNVEIYRQINVDKSTLNQRGYYVDRRRDAISTYINVESTLSVCWVLTRNKMSEIKKKHFQHIESKLETITIKVKIKYN